MKILYLIPYSPVPPIFGGAMRIYYLLKGLAAHHDVTVVMFGTPSQLSLFQEDFGGLVEETHLIPVPGSRKYKRLAQFLTLFSSTSYGSQYCYSRKMQNKIHDLLSSRNFDVVHTEFAFMGQYTLGDDVIKVLDAHNVEYDNFRRMWLKSTSFLKRWYYKREYKQVYREEIQRLCKQDMLLATSGEDIKIFKKDIRDTPAYVVPNGVDTSYFIPSDQVTEPYYLVFTGMMGYTPNNDGVIWFLDEIFPRILKKIPETKIYIVGNRPSDQLKRRQSNQIIVTGFVDDVRPYVWKSGVFIVPLRMGSGTRLKVVEALAMRKPVVSTSIGCEGIEVEDGKSILIQDEPEPFADSVVHLLQNRKLRAELAQEGYALVRSTYDWSVIGNKMLDAYSTLSDKKRRVRAPVNS